MNLLFQRDVSYSTYVNNETVVENNQQIVTTTNYDYSIVNVDSFHAHQFQNNNIPHLFYYNGHLCGLIMKRTKTKVFFKKWKHCIFEVIPPRVQLFKTVNDWNNHILYWSIDLRSFMVSVNKSIIFMQVSNSLASISHIYKTKG